MCWIRVTLFQKSYHSLNLILSPRSKSGGPKRTSQPGQEDGREKKRKKSFLRGKFCRTKTPFLIICKTGDFDLGISPWKRHLQKNGVHHDKGNKKCKKTVISDFLFSNFRHRDFSIQSLAFFIFSKIPKSTNFDDFGRQIAEASLTLRSKSMGGKRSSVCILQSWFYQFFS